jgi:hypothetical protein
MKQVRYCCNTHFGVCSLYGQEEGQAVVDSWVFWGRIEKSQPPEGRMSNKECPCQLTAIPYPNFPMLNSMDVKLFSVA